MLVSWVGCYECKSLFIKRRLLLVHMGVREISGLQCGWLVWIWLGNILLFQAVMEVMEALVNMGDIFAELWPLDDSPRILLRILIHYKFAAGLRDSEVERCRIIAEFCDTVLRDNASRAVGRDPPLSFRQAKERWLDVAERYGPVGLVGAHRPGKKDGGKAVAGPVSGGQTAAKGGAAARNRSARFLSGGRSHAVCFDYNRGACNRKPAGCGFEDNKGVVFAHVCNYWLNVANKHCLAAHSRVGNH
jgi:hypothetical protein